MKRSLVSICLIFSMFFLSSCQNSNTASLSETDYQYIDTVYNAMSEWDISCRDGNQTHRINKIAFYNDDGIVSFYVNFPIAGYYGWGYTVSQNSLKIIPYDIFSNNINQALTSAKGTPWNHSLTDEAKYELIKKAYLQSKTDY